MTGTGSGSPVAAQSNAPEEIQADWHNVIYSKSKPGKRGRAEGIQETYYAPGL
jgi:hypothetical protein